MWRFSTSKEQVAKTLMPDLSNGQPERRQRRGTEARASLSAIASADAGAMACVRFIDVMPIAFLGRLFERASALGVASPPETHWARLLEGLEKRLRLPAL